MAITISHIAKYIVIVQFAAMSNRNYLINFRSNQLILRQLCVVLFLLEMRAGAEFER